jgi:type I restriction enzyme S subunit
MMPFGRTVTLVTDKAAAEPFRLGLEAIESSTGRLVPEPATDYEGDGVSFAADDILFGKLRPYLAKAWLADRPGTAVGDFHVYRPDRSRVHPGYLRWVVLARNFLDPVESSVFGAKMPRASWDFIKKVEIFVPPLDEQRVIAKYLDRETAQIDELITEQQRLIDMLTKRRQDLIRALVLGDENPFAPSKNTTFTAIGHHFSVTLGKMLDAGRGVRPDEQLLPYIRAGNIQDNGLRLNDVKEMAYSEKEASSLDLRAGDLLVVEGGAVGTSVVLLEDMPGWSFQKTVNRLRPLDGWSSAWLGYVLRTYRDIGIIDIICNKSTIAHLTAEKVRALRVPLVQPLEQERVVALLDDEATKTDTLIHECEHFIELAQERRSALITAAVTGQIDLRKVA